MSPRERHLQLSAELVRASVPDAPEALVRDAARKMANTILWVAVETAGRKLAKTVQPEAEV